MQIGGSIKISHNILLLSRGFCACYSYQTKQHQHEIKKVYISPMFHFSLMQRNIKIEIEYPIFRKIRSEVKETVSLDDVREILSNVKESFSDEVLKERMKEWR